MRKRAASPFSLRRANHTPLLIALLTVALAGCGGGPDQKDPTFFTSGSRDADQRASQRMAKAEQLQGSGEAAGDKSVKAPEKQSLFTKLGGEEGITKIVDDFTTRMLDDPRVNFQRKGLTRGGLNPIHRGDSIAWSDSPANEQKELLAIVESTREQIVEER